MAEQIENRSIYEVLWELYSGGQEAALEKYAKVQHTRYEIGLYWYKHYPLAEIDSKAKIYFFFFFLGGKKIGQVTPEEMKEALTRLNYAVGNTPCMKDGKQYYPGAHGRCLRLVEELNRALIAEGFKPLRDPEKFLNYMIYDWEFKKNYLGEVIHEHGAPVLVFHDKENRRDFWAETKYLLSKGKMMDLQKILRRVFHERKYARPIHTPKKTPKKTSKRSKTPK